MAHILLIEDSIDLAEIIILELERSGHTVLFIQEGEKAFEILKKNCTDLIILDWMLPGINGLDVLHQVRADSNIPVLMLTARGDLADRIAGLELGADDYLIKPFDMPELIARIHALLRRAARDKQVILEDRSSANNILSLEGITLSPSNRTCECNGNNLELTRLEFDLLELLMKNPGRVFNRRYLQETIWDQAYLEGDRSIDNTIMRLRKKLGSSGELIETVREVGYRFKLDLKTHEKQNLL
ncbi:response regulator transcription factor [Pelolinea submarina]|uniref:Two-component system phosphate regulon response regulator PhoB n=1 Tax=Pelolinea submarina TaxID=913107 RepID=A0A3E0ABX0_9CHLR|nr:response regulator transcription factor [Pelolinea submarina]REG08660.1 two-component system phosphate regulon response regulator PhoB [Pelolinea submarina]